MLDASEAGGGTPERAKENTKDAAPNFEKDPADNKLPIDVPSFLKDPGVL